MSTPAPVKDRVPLLCILCLVILIGCGILGPFIAGDVIRFDIR